MIVLPHIDILDESFSSNKFSDKKQLLNILYNNTVDICLSKRYIKLIEDNITNKDAFESFITEMSDSNRIKIQQTDAKDELEQEFIALANDVKISFLIPIIKNDNSNLTKKIINLVVINEVKPINRHWVTLELLTKNHCNVSYLNFKNDNDIKNFFDTLFLIPKFITKVSVFDREQTPNFLLKLKGKHINYYTYLRSGYDNKHTRLEIKKDLRKDLGGHLKLHFTSDKRLIHERKILFENILVSSDNSFKNLTCSDPTWELVICYDKIKAEDWEKKCCKFREVTD